MATIDPPKQAGDYPDRSADCEFSIEPAFTSLAIAAENAGWSDEEVAFALIELARSHLNALGFEKEVISKLVLEAGWS